MKFRKPRWQDSYIIRFFAFLTHFVYSAISAGFLGRIFTSYNAADRTFRASALGRLTSCEAEKAGSKSYRAFRRNMALAMNDSLLIRGVTGFVQGLLRCGLRTLGLFLVVSGSYSALMYWLFSMIWKSHVVDALNLFGGFAALLLGILLLFSDASLGYALANGFFFGKFLAPVFGVSDETLKEMQEVGKQYYVIAVPVGMVVGALNALTSPLYLLFALLAFLLILLVLSIPEAGIMLLILFIPFVGLLPQGVFWLLPVAVLPVVGYIGKLLRGTRILRVELQDLPVLLMLLFALLSGFSVAGGSAWKGAVLSVLLMSVYFVVVNTIATPRWRHRCRAVLILSATAASLFGIVQFIVAALLEGGSLPELGGAVHAGFADHTTLAYFLTVAFPFALSAFVGNHKKYRFFTGFALVTVVAATVLTWVQSAIIAIVVMLLVFFLIYEHRTFPYVLVGGVLLPVAVAIIPDRTKNAVLDVLRADSGMAFARSATAGHLAGRIFFEGGNGIFSHGAGFLRLVFGLGSGGIERFCTLYTLVPPASVTGSMNFWLYRLLEGGVFGVLLPAAFFFLLYQNCFSLLLGMREKRERISPITGIVMMTGVLTLSIFRYAWYDPAAMLVFFIAAALIAADMRYERQRTLPTDPMEKDGSVVEFDYYGNA